MRETVRRAVALGGDCDTIAAIAGAAAEAAWGVPEDLRAKVDALLPIRLIELIRRFESVFAVSAPKRMPPDHPSARRPFAVVFASPEGRRVFYWPEHQVEALRCLG